MRREALGPGVLMRCLAFIFLALAGLLTAPGAVQPASAGVVITVNKAAQRMTVFVDGAARYTWAVSSGLNGGPPSGTFRPQRMERMWYSRTYDWSPMPHAIFFFHGFAIHGTNYVARLGRRASHGCVRLHPRNAATLFALVQRYGKSQTRIIISDTGRYATR